MEIIIEKENINNYLRNRRYNGCGSDALSAAQ